MDDVLDPDREVYPHAPLKLVACEIAYTLAPGVNVEASAQGVYDALGTDYALPGVAPMGLIIEVPPGGGPPRTTTAPEGFRFLDRERTRSIVVTSRSMILEASSYTRFEEFAQRVSDAVTAVADVVRIAAAHRIGLRYIDEIPLCVLPEGQWDPYFSDGVLAPLQPVKDVGAPAEFITTCRYDLGADRQVTLRTGVLGAAVVSADGPLAIKGPSTPPLALIDIDSAWEAKTATTPLKFDAAAIEPLLMALHAPVRALFENSITDDLRNHVLRQESS
jgi:uncharacterized protein (TIGR04255 family)